MKTVYLAGPITGLTYEGCTDWRFKAIEELAKFGIKGLSPMRGKAFLANLKLISGTGEEYKDMGVLATQKSVCARDRMDCTTSDLILMNLLGAKAVSIGTMVELGWADGARRPVVLVIEEGNPHHHMFVRELAGFIVPTLEEALAVIGTILA